jgi:cation diffusion facilitator CzcD-associated flavoprotein CzcO
VLVVGAGNSGCDIAVESAQNARTTFHSTRRGYYYAPKFVLGMPADQIAERGLRLGLPLAVRRAFNVALIKLILGDPTKYGLPKPDHKFYETHPIVNSQMLYYVGHGEIKPKPDVKELRGDRVLFVDGSEEQIDVLIYATGFNITFPFIDQKYLNWRDNRPNLYMNIFHPLYDNLFVAGLIQPDSGQWGLVDYQAQLIARFVHAQRHNPRKADQFRRKKASERPRLNHGINYVNSTRHYVEVEHFSYRNGLKKLLGQF